VRTSIGPHHTAGIAFAGASFWLAAAHGAPALSAAAPLRLASVEAVLTPPPLSSPGSATCSGAAGGVGTTGTPGASAATGHPGQVG
jgi:hypothetical protein